MPSQTTPTRNVRADSDDVLLPPPTELRLWREHEHGLAGLAERGTETPSQRRDPDWADVALPLPLESMSENRGRLDERLNSRLAELEARESQLEAERAALRARRRNKPPQWRGFLLRSSATAPVEDSLQRLQIREHETLAPSTINRPSSSALAPAPAERAPSASDSATNRVSRFKQRQLERRAQQTLTNP
jgi:hypothetical protein